MTGRYKKTQSKNRSRFYILLSILFVLFMFKWGVPLFTNLIAGKGAVRISTDNDIIPPQAPVIFAVPSATNSARIHFDGFTEKGAGVELLLNDVSNKMTVADQYGSFSFDTFLVIGANRIQFRAKDGKGNESMSEVSLINLDTKPIELSITSPKDGSEFFGKLNQTVDITGSVNKSSSQVTLNNSFIRLESNGTFTHRFLLAEGENILQILAEDEAGNKTETRLRLIYTP